MKKIMLFIPIILFLSACTGAATESIEIAATAPMEDLVSQNTPVGTPANNEPGIAELTTTHENAVSIEMQLVLGTIKLEGTELAITKDQAGFLIPLWTNFKTVSQSMMPAPGGPGQAPASSTLPSNNNETVAQLEELARQIQTILTPEQLTHIASLQITQETARTIMQEQGLTMGNPRPGDGEQAPQGDMFPGGPGSGPATGPDGQFPTPPPGQDRQRNSMIPTELIDQLIQLLEKKTAS
jgi:hypothetical protein